MNDSYCLTVEGECTRCGEAVRSLDHVTIDDCIKAAELETALIKLETARMESKTAWLVRAKARDD